MSPITTYAISTLAGITCLETTASDLLNAPIRTTPFVICVLRYVSEIYLYKSFTIFVRAFGI